MFKLPKISTMWAKILPRNQLRNKAGSPSSQALFLRIAVHWHASLADQDHNLTTQEDPNHYLHPSHHRLPSNPPEQIMLHQSPVKLISSRCQAASSFTKEKQQKQIFCASLWDVFRSAGISAALGGKITAMLCGPESDEMQLSLGDYGLFGVVLSEMCPSLGSYTDHTKHSNCWRAQWRALIAASHFKSSTSGIYCYFSPRLWRGLQGGRCHYSWFAQVYLLRTSFH